MANKIMKVLKIGDNTYDFDAAKLGGELPSYYATAAQIEEIEDEIKGIEADLVSNLQYKGSLTAAGTVEACGTNDIGITPEAVEGDVYIVKNTGYVNGVHVDIGDMWLCKAAAGKATSSTFEAVNTCWDVIQGNIQIADLENRFSESDHTHSVSGEVEVEPSGNISQPTFTGEENKHSHTIDLSHEHTFEGADSDISVTGTPDGSVLADHSYTPEGEIAPITYTPEGGVTISGEVTDTDATFTPVVAIATDGSHDHTVTATYTPEGSVSGGAHAHTASVSVTGSYDAASSTLTLGADATVDSSTPVDLTFTGTEATISGGTDSAGAHTHTATATGIKLSAEFTGSQTTLTPEFTGTEATLSHSFVSAITLEGTYTPSGSITPINTTRDTNEYIYTPYGTISTPVFTGTKQTWGVVGATDAASN